jgi:hypothetical protein
MKTYLLGDPDPVEPQKAPRPLRPQPVPPRQISRVELF